MRFEKRSKKRERGVTTRIGELFMSEDDFKRIEAFAAEARALSDRLLALRLQPGCKNWIPAMSKCSGSIADFAETLYRLACREQGEPDTDRLE